MSDSLIMEQYCSDVLGNLDCLNQVALRIQLPPGFPNKGNLTNLGVTVDIRQLVNPDGNILITINHYAKFQPKLFNLFVLRNCKAVHQKLSASS